VVSPDLHRVASSFEVMSPLFEPSDDGEHLSVMDSVISLYMSAFERNIRGCQV
jgi:hypothetical protein